MDDARRTRTGHTRQRAHGGLAHVCHPACSGRKMSLSQRFVTTLIVDATCQLTGVQARWHAEPQVSARIYFANHSSHLDGAVIWASPPPLLCPRTRAVAALDYWGKSARRRYLSTRVFDVLMIDRNPKQSREQRNAPLQPLLDALDTGDALILFPKARAAQASASRRSGQACITSRGNGPTWRWCRCAWISIVFRRRVA